MLVSKYGFKYNKAGKLLRKPVSELVNSTHSVHVKCDECDTIFRVIWGNRNIRLAHGRPELCKSCCKKQERNSQYGKDRSELTSYSRSFVKNHARDFSDAAKEQMSATRSQGIANGTIVVASENRGKKYNYLSVKTGQAEIADSGLELLRMHQLDSNPSVLSWTKQHGITIPYTHNGVIRYYVPDFRIVLDTNVVMIEEVKGHEAGEIDQSELAALKEYCLTNKFAFNYITKRQLNLNNDYKKFLKTLKK